VNAAGPRNRVHERLAWTFSREQLMKGQLQRLLADVFGYEPTQVCVDAPDDEDDWDEPDDDVDVLKVC
jgi:hypothetical protein